MKDKKEPIQNPVFIWGITLLLLLSIPWYLPAGAYKPVILGFPFWAFLSLSMVLALILFTSWFIFNEWEE